jgi:hypothetical protein
MASVLANTLQNKRLTQRLRQALDQLDATAPAGVVITAPLLIREVLSDGGVATNALQGLVPSADLRQRVLTRLAHREGIPKESPQPAPVDVDRLMESAADLAKRYGNPLVGSEHVTLAMLQQPDTDVVAALAIAGVTPAELHSEILDLLGVDSDDDAEHDNDASLASYLERPRSPLPRSLFWRHVVALVMPATLVTIVLLVVSLSFAQADATHPLRFLFTIANCVVLSSMCEGMMGFNYHQSLSWRLPTDRYFALKACAVAFLTLIGLVLLMSNAGPSPKGLIDLKYYTSTISWVITFVMMAVLFIGPAIVFRALSRLNLPSYTRTP